MRDLPRVAAAAGLRAWRRLPDAPRRALVGAASVVGDRPRVGLPPARRVLVVAPHPDDETIGAGGTIRRLVDAGARVDVVAVTDGEATLGAAGGRASVGARRRGELAAACELLGARPPVFLGLPDGGVGAHLDRLVDELAGLVADAHPQVVVAPWPLDRHPDHLAVAAAAARLEPPDDVQLWGYETHLPLPPTHVVDVTDVAAVKRAALALHVTAGEAFDLSALMGLSRWRSLLTDAGRGFAEAFLVTGYADARLLHARLVGHGRGDGVRGDRAAAVDVDGPRPGPQ